MDSKTYKMFDQESAADYILGKGFFADSREPLVSREIGDGNMNYIYRISCGEKSLILKQAGEATRLSSGKNISRKRNQREARAMIRQNEIVPGSTPKVYLYDEVMDCMVMEDMKDYAVMRQALLDGGPLWDSFGVQIGHILAENYRQTSDVQADHIRKKYEVKEFINPELCEISERLVFDEPIFNLSGSNRVEPENNAYVEENIYVGEELKKEVGKLKFQFMTSSQSFIHGDLHTGSLFINEEGVKIFDSEFAFYGPTGYDVGNIVAHLLLAKTNALLTDRNEVVDWTEKQIRSILRIFTKEAAGQKRKPGKDAFEKELNQWYIRNILADSAGYCGTEIIRRVLGVAKVKDVQSLERRKRCQAERMLLEKGIDLVINRKNYTEASDFDSII